MSVAVVGLVLAVAAGCGGGASSDDGGATEAAPEETSAATGGDTAAAAGSESGGEATKVRIGVAPFQDLLSIYIGEEQGWYDEEGLDLDITQVELQEAGEALVGGAVDVASVCDVDVLVKYPQAPELRLTNPAYIFLGSALFVRPDSGIKSYDDFIAEGMSHEDAVTAVGEQLRGKTAIAVANSDQELAIKVAALKGGVDPSTEMNFIDLEANEGLAAFLSGEGDIYNGGLPQRARALQEGMKPLIGAKELRPEGVIHCGFATTDGYLADNMDVLVKFQHVWYRIQQAIQDDPEGMLAIIQKVLNERTGAEVTVEDLKGIWNNDELFPATDTEMAEQILDASSEYYWRDRYDFAKTFYTDAGTIQGEVDLDTAFAYPQLHEAYVEMYGDEAPVGFEPLK